MKSLSIIKIIFITLIYSLLSFQMLFATPSFQLSCTRSFSEYEEVKVIYEKWHNRQADYQSQLRSLQLALYKVEDIQNFFNQTIFRQAQLKQVPDSLLQRLPLIRSWSYKLNKAGQNISLGRLPSGVYVLETIDNGYAAQVPIIVSNYNMMVKSLGEELLAFMVDKNTGQAIKDFQCYAYLGNNQGQDIILSPNKQLDGLAYFYKDVTLANGIRNFPVIAFKDNQIAVSRSYFEFQRAKKVPQAHLIIQSPAARPESWLRFKGIYRQLGAHGYTVPVQQVTYWMSNAKGEQMFKKTVDLDANGTFTDSLFIEKDAVLGNYTLSDQWGNQEITQVQAYKKPEYEVNIVLDKEQYTKGELINVNVQASYFFGATVKKGTVNYKVMRGRFYTPWYHNNPYSNWYNKVYAAPYSINNKLVHQGTQQLDVNGNTTFSVPTEYINQSSNTTTVAYGYNHSYNYNENYTYTIFAEVMDESRRTVSSSINTIVAETDFNLSAISEKDYYGEGEKIKVIISTTDFKKRGVQGRFIAKLYRQAGLYSGPRQGRTRGRGTATVLQEISGQTDAETGLAHIQLSPEQSGHYRIEITGVDSGGRKTTNSCYTYVLKLEEEPVWWQKNGRGVHIFTDRRVYEAGDTVYARMYIPNVAVDALISLNDHRFLEYWLHRFEGNAQHMSYQEFYFVLKNNLFGKVNLGIDYLYKERQYSQSKDIIVIPKQQYLKVQLSFDAQDYRPRNKALGTLQVTDEIGQPIPNANVTLSTIDESIYTLYPNTSRSIHNAFYHDRFSVQARSSKNNFNSNMRGEPLEKARFGWRKEKMGNFERNMYLPKNKNYRLNCSEKNWPSHTTVVYGYIINDETGEPIPNAEIQVGNNTYYADATGYYFLKNFVVNYASLKFSNNKKSTFIKNIEIPENECDVSLSVAISPKKEEVIDLNPNAQAQVLDYFKALEVSVENYEQYLEGNTSPHNSALAYKEMKKEIAPEEMIMIAENERMKDKESKDAIEMPISSYGSYASATTSSASYSSRSSTTAAPSYGNRQVYVPPPPSAYQSNSSAYRSQNQSPYNAGSSAYRLRNRKLTATPTIRSDFKDAICWKPTITTDANGQAIVTIQLPDDLTTWRTTATVITPDTKVGEAVAKIVVKKGLLVRMETPRFMRLGDQLFITTNIHNAFSQPKEVQVSLESNGLNIEGTAQTIVVPPNGEQRIDWPITTEWAEDVQLTVKALSEGESDAMQVKVPVLPHGLQVIESQSAYLSNKDEKTLHFNIRPDVDRNSIGLEINAIPSVTSALLTAMDDLIAYPYGCVEQTMSRFLPNVVVANTLKELGTAYSGTIAGEELEKMVAKGVERLSKLQKDNGSWGWWKNDKMGHPFMTAYVCYGLFLAKEAGYFIHENSYKAGIRALQKQLEANTTDDPTTLAYQAMVAAQCGLGKKAWINWKEKAVLGHEATAYQQALWLQTALLAKKGKIAKAIVEKLERKVQQNGHLNYWETAKFRYNWQTDRVETTANVVKALSMYNSEHPQIVGAVEWLLSKRRGKSWRNTRQTAMTILGLKDRIVLESRPNVELQIYANNQLVEQRTVVAENVYQRSPSVELKPENYLVDLDVSLQETTNVLLSVLKEGSNTVKIVQKGTGTHFVNAQLKYFLTEQQVATLDTSHSTFEIQRRYYKLKKQVQEDGTVQYIKSPATLNSIYPGDDILVKVAIKSPQSQQFVLIEDPIPAGCEFIRSNEGYIIDGEKSYRGNDTWNQPNKSAWSWSSWAVHRELRDDKLALTATRLPKGTYRYSYLLKAQTPGIYKVTPTIAQLMYYPEQRGFSEFVEMVIKE